MPAVPFSSRMPVENRSQDQICPFFVLIWYRWCEMLMRLVRHFWLPKERHTDLKVGHNCSLLVCKLYSGLSSYLFGSTFYNRIFLISLYKKKEHLDVQHRWASPAECSTLTELSNKVRCVI